MKSKNIIVFVNSLPVATIDSIEAYAKKRGEKLRIMLIRDSKSHAARKKHTELSDKIDIVLDCDFSVQHKLAACLLPYQEELLAVTCRSERYIETFAKLIPHVPYLRTPTTESLIWATDKLEMRRRLTVFDPKNTPKYSIVHSNTKAERKRIADKIGFPLVIKPANLAASLLVSVCYHEEEFEQVLKKAFRKIKKVYKEHDLSKMPTILAEEYMDGEMYSSDVYVTGRGKVHICPLVKVVTGHNRGKDDFYNYFRITPTTLKKSTITRAEEVIEHAVRALGLRSTTVHVELMKIDDEWKVIELGPRIGGFRPQLYRLAFGIDHALNDILVRIPKKITIPKSNKGHAAALKFFPEKEGILSELKGVKKVQELKSFSSIKVDKKVGDKVIFAKNGGKQVCDIVLFNKDRSKLLADVRRVEQLVKISVENGSGSRKKTKKAVKKKTKKA